MLRHAHILCASFCVCRIDAVKQLAIIASGQPRSVLLEPRCQAREPAVAERCGCALERMRFAADSLAIRFDRQLPEQCQPGDGFVDEDDPDFGCRLLADLRGEFFES